MLINPQLMNLRFLPQKKEKAEKVAYKLEQGIALCMYKFLHLSLLVMNCLANRSLFLSLQMTLTATQSPAQTLTRPCLWPE